MDQSFPETSPIWATGGDIGALMRQTDWSQTALGPPTQWPLALRLSLNTCLDSRFPILLWWGPELVMLYNDAYRSLIGHKHPAALGSPGRTVWPEIWDTIGPMLAGVLTEGRATWSEDQLLVLERNGYPEECYFTFSYSPIRDETGQVSGVYCAVTETTRAVIDARRLNLLHTLSTDLKGQPTVAAVYAQAERLLAGHPDFPKAQIEPIPAATDLTGADLVLPIRVGDQAQTGALLRLNLNPQRPADADYHRFCQLLADQISAEATNVQTLATERERTQTLTTLAQAREASERNLKNLLMQAPVAIAILRGPQFVVELANERHLQFWNRPAADVIGKPVFEAIPSAAGQGYEAILDRVLQTGERWTANEQAIELDRNGKPERIWVDVIYEPFYEAGQVVGILEVVHDVTAQVEARQQVEENEALLQQIFQRTSVGIAIFRGTQRIIEVANPTVCAIWGRTEAQVLEQPLFEALPEIVGQGFEELLTTVQQTGIPYVGTEIPATLYRNGQLDTVYFDFVYEPLPDADGYIDRILVTATEVTERHMARQRIEDDASKLQSLFEQAPVGIAILRGPDHTFDLVNAFYLSMVGRQRADEIVGKPLLEALPEIEGQGFDQLLTNVVETNVPFRASGVPVKLVREGKLDTAYVDFVYQPLPAPDSGVLAVVTEVTEQVLARQRIEASQREFEQLTNLIPQIIWTARPDGSTDYFNQPWYDYTGFEKADGDQSWLPILHPDDVELTLAAWYHSVQTGQPYQIEYRFADRRNPGQYRWFVGRAQPVRDETGAIVKWFGSCTDIQDQKTQSERLEQLIAERTESLRQANLSLERINTDLEHSNFDLMQFASVASHDLKEPLRKIQAFSRLLAESLTDRLAADERSHFERIIRAAARMQALVDDVLRLSKLSKTDVRYESVDLNALIDRIQDDLEVTIREKRAAIRVGTLPIIEAVPGQMHQLFQNLISNALKFSNGPTPTVSIRAVSDAGMVSPAEAGLAGGSAGIEITDNGIGFDAQYAERIFGMFQRLHGRGQYEGTGIGLTICRRIVENHHGHITAEGRPGEGATFRVVLPVRQHATPD